LRRFYEASSLRCFHRKLRAFMLSGPHYAVIRVCDAAGNVIETPNMRASSRLSMGLVPSNFVGEMAEIEVVSANV
jgi:hypothetical protein